MKKRISAVIGIVLAIVGLMMATGIDQNPVQALYSLVCVGAAVGCLLYAERAVSEASTNARNERQGKSAKAA